MDETTIEKIRKEVRKSGHPVNLKVSIILNKKGWYVKNAPRYFDPRLKTFREVDIVAKKKSNFIGIGYDTLIIECKKSENHPWVFFNQGKENTKEASLTLTTHLGKNEEVIYELIREKGMFKEHYYYKKPLSAYYFVSNVKQDCKKSKEIFEAVTKVLDACLFYVNQKAKILEECKKLKLKLPESYLINFFYPIIVLDGKLYEVRIMGEKEYIDEVKHISLLVEYELEKPYLAQSLNENIYKPVFSKSFIVDIVRLDYFKEFLKNFDLN